MKEARQSSPFVSDQRQGQLEKWICRQHQQHVLPEEQLNPMTEEKPQSEQTCCAMQQPRHGQYDAIIHKLRSARRLAGQDQQWSG